jgi:D-aspartate ligase
MTTSMVRVPLRRSPRPAARRLRDELGVDDPPVACVIGGMDLVRPLGRAGIPTVVVSPPGFPQCYSRFTKGIVELHDIRHHPEDLVTDLIAFASTQTSRPVLLVDQDEYLLIVSRYREQLEPCFRFLVADPLVEDLLDKERFAALTARFDLPVPPTQVLHPVGTVPADVTIPFPIILKPLTRRDRDVPWTSIAGTAKAVRIDGRPSLDAIWPSLVASGADVLAQTLIPGPESRIESYHVYVRATGQIAGEFTGREVRTYPRRFGHSTAVITTDAPDVLALGRDLVDRVGLRGVAKFDFKRAPDGTLFLLEINPRLSFWNHPGAVAGVHLAELMYRDLIDAPIRPTGPARAGVRWCDILPDAMAARAGGLSTAAWLRWVMNAETRAEWAADDPLPFIRGTIWRQRGAVPRTLLRLGRRGVG